MNDGLLEKTLGTYKQYPDINENYHHLIRLLAEDDFYGQLMLNFECGKIVHCKKNESIKL